MQYVALIALFWSACSSQQAEKPVCSGRNTGLFWPEEANVSKDAARKLYQTGELELCSQVKGKYRWQHISVNVHDLSKGQRGSTSR